MDAKRRRKKRERQQFEFEARKLSRIIVTVEAFDEAEARELAERGDWLDEQQSGMSDWEILGRVR